MLGSGISFSRFCACGDSRLAGNDVAGKLRAGGRSGAAGGIEDIEAQTAEVAGALFRGGNAQQRSTAGVAPRALKVAEVEQLVLLNRPADGSAELVPLREWNRASVRNSESRATA